MSSITPGYVGGQPTLTEIIDRGPITLRQYLIVALCLIFNMVDGFDITAMAVTAHQIGKDMQLSADELGLVFSFTLAGMMLGAMFLASFSDVVGRRVMIIVSLLVVGSTVLLTAHIDSLGQLITLRFLAGLGAGAMLASVATLAAEYSPEKYRALCVTAVTAGYPLGATMTGLAANQILPEFGWRGIFTFGGSIALLLAALAYLLIPESLQYLDKRRPTDALARINALLLKLKREPLDKLPDENPDTGQPASRQNVLSKMLALLAPEFRRSTLTLWLTVFLCISTLYFLLSWIPKMMINLGYTEETANHAFTVHNLGGVLGIFALGYLASRWNLSRLISAFTIIAAVSMWAFAAAASVNAAQDLLMVLIFVIGFVLHGGYTGLYAVAAKVYPIEIRSTGVGWAIGLGRFGAVIGPGLAGYMLATGFSITVNFLVFAMPLLIGGFLAYRLRVR